MTKKIRAGNKGARRSKPKTLKRVELVRPEGLSPGEEPQKRHVPEDKPFELANASAVIATPEKTEEDQMRILKGSAYTRGATRRATQKALQRKPFAIITPEEFSYVKRDLITIGILSSIMVAAMVVMTFILGID